MARPGFMLYFDNLMPCMDVMSDEQLGALVRALGKYAITGEVGEMDKFVFMAFNMMYPSIDRDAQKYNDKVRKNKYANFCKEAKQRGEDLLSFEEWQSVYYCEE